MAQLEAAGRARHPQLRHLPPPRTDHATDQEYWHTPRTGQPAGVAITFVVVLGLAIILAKVSSVTVERYGAKLLNVYDTDGRPRNYYPHDITGPTQKPQPAPLVTR